MQTAPAHADCKEPGAEVSPEEAACQSVPADRFITPDMLPNRYVEGDNGEPEVPSPRKVRLQTNGYTEAYIPTVVVVIGFDNMPYSNYINWRSAVFSTEDSARSAKKYYHDMSYGKMTFEPVAETSSYGSGGNTNEYDRANDGIVHVKLDSDILHKDWSSTTNKTNTAGPRMMARAFIQAVQKASEYVDFTQYDDNNDGVLKEEELALVFVVAGYDSGSAVRSFNDNYYLRSHKWSIGGILEAHNFTDLSKPKVTKNGKTVTVNPYVAVSEHVEWKRPDGTVIVLHERMSSMIHELGHHMGLPDLYDTTEEKGSWSGYNVNYLSIMAEGSWGRDEDGHSIPYSMDPWSKIRLGWIEPSVMNTPNRIYAASAQNYRTLEKNNILKVPASQISGTGKEYYLIENRRFDEWDEGLPYRYSKTSVETSGNAGGLILWHIDEQVLDACASEGARVGYYDINNTVHRPGIMPLTAEVKDSKFTFISDGSRVYHERPFFDKQIWDRKYKGLLGQELDLPTYGGKDINSGPSTRSLSGVRIEFIAAAGSTNVGIRYIGKGHVHSWGTITKKNFSDNVCEGGTYDESTTCSVCGQEKLTLRYVQPGTHLKTTRTPGSPAGCVYAGTIEYYTCDLCGKMFRDAACTKEITSSDILIQPYGHDWETLYVTEPPGYDYEGTGYARCRRCGIEEFISLPHLDISDKMGEDGTALGTGASEEAADKNLISYSAEKDPAGSRFSKLKLKSSYQTKTSIKLTWSSAGASKYVVYGSKCGAGNKLKKITDTSAKSISVSKIDGVKLKKSSYYKFVVVAVDADGNVISSSKQIHIATKGTKKKSNPSSVSVSSTVKKKAARLKKSKSLKLSAKVKCKKGCKYSKHVGLRYESSDPSIVTVSSKGVIKGKSKGTAKVYAYAQNGASKTITVKVK